jgi:cephalosporin-C deacetylase-like acetyl esterase
MSTDTQTIQYPSPAEVDAWMDSVWELARSVECRAAMLGGQDVAVGVHVRHNERCRYVEFSPQGMSPFYGFWQPALSHPAPLLLHVPGYGSEMSAHPEIVAAGFNVLHVSPLGYSTPTGTDESKKRDGNWPVLPDTALSGGTKGYRQWLANCVMAVDWAMRQPEVIADRVSFFGTSQGGGGALLLGSLYRGRGVRCVAADLPFLTDFRTSGGQGAYELFAGALSAAFDKASVWRAIGLIDTLSHIHRLDMPVLLTAGGQDGTCPAFTIENFFARLTGTRSFTYLKDMGHRYTTEFIPLATAWFRLYA